MLRFKFLEANGILYSASTLPEENKYEKIQISDAPQ